jgi:hypothetical protein
MMNPSQSPTPPIFRFGHFMKPWGSLKLTIFGLAALALPLSVLADEPAEKFVTA